MLFLFYFHRLQYGKRPKQQITGWPSWPHLGQTLQQILSIVIIDQSNQRSVTDIYMAVVIGGQAAKPPKCFYLFLLGVLCLRQGPNHCNLTYILLFVGFARAKTLLLFCILIVRLVLSILTIVFLFLFIIIPTSQFFQRFLAFNQSCILSPIPTMLVSKRSAPSGDDGYDFWHFSLLYFLKN